MHLVEEAEAATRDTLASLELDRDGSLTTICQQVEMSTVNQLIEEVVNVVYKTSTPDRHFRPLAERTFSLNGQRYNVAVADDVINPGTRSTTRPIVNPTIADTAVQADGRYETLVLTLPDDLAILQEPVLKVSSAVLHSGYRWLTSHIECQIDEAGAIIFSPLQVKLRELLEPDLMGTVWLYIHASGVTVQVTDAHSVREGLAKIRAVRLCDGKSYLEAFLLIAGRQFEYATTASKDAIEARRPVLGELSEVGYYGCGAEATESRYLGGDYFVVLPLAQTNQAGLTATFPPRVRESVEWRLQNARPEFRAILETYGGETASRFDKLKHRLNYLEAVPSPMWERSGAFVRGLLGLE